MQEAFQAASNEACDDLRAIQVWQCLTEMLVNNLGYSLRSTLAQYNMPPSLLCSWMLGSTSCVRTSLQCCGKQRVRS